MKIGIIGTRGIPNQYGGYEQFAAHAAPELVRRGHEVIVYNSSLHPYKETSWKGVQIVHCFDPENRIGTAGQFIYDLNCILDSRKRKFDVILQLGYTSSSIWSRLFPGSSLLVTNMDGLEWKRSKYSPGVQRFLKKAEKWAALSSDHLIADSKGIRQYLLEKYNKNSEFIAYGADLVTQQNESVLNKWSLEKYSYDLLIARMEPENSIEMIIEAHLISRHAKPLLIVGNYGNKFGTYLFNRYNSPKIRFVGAVYDMDVLNNLRRFSFFYYHGHSVGGTNPSLLEAMASYSLIMAHDNIFNRTVLGDDAFYFSSAGDIAAILDRQPAREDYSQMLLNNAKRIAEEYSWPHIINLLENFLMHVVDHR